MSLKEQLLQDMKESMKSKDVLRKDTIQIVRAGVLQIEKDEQTALDDEGVMEVITREIKKRRDVLPDYERSGRQELIDDIQRQLEILIAYLPEQLSNEAVGQIVTEVIHDLNASGMKDMGRVMQTVTSKVKGRTDNKLVSELVKMKLNELK